MKSAEGQMGEAHSKMSTLPNSSRRPAGLSTSHTLTCCNAGIDAALPIVLQVKRWESETTCPKLPSREVVELGFGPRPACYRYCSV